jgi:peroxiredoxin
MLRKALILIFVILIGFSAAAESVLKVGSPPPSFTLRDINGKTFDLDRTLGGKVVILSFFASWSKSCKEEINFLNELSKKYSGRGLKIVGVSYDRKSRDLKQFVNQNALHFTVLHDSRLKTLKKYRILIIPTLFVIDQKGNVNSIYVDFDKNVEKAVAQDIAKLLKK